MHGFSDGRINIEVGRFVKCYFFSITNALYSIYVYTHTISFSIPINKQKKNQNAKMYAISWSKSETQRKNCVNLSHMIDCSILVIFVVFISNSLLPINGNVHRQKMLSIWFRIEIEQVHKMLLLTICFGVVVRAANQFRSITYHLVMKSMTDEVKEPRKSNLSAWKLKSMVPTTAKVSILFCCFDFFFFHLLLLYILSFVGSIFKWSPI